MKNHTALRISLIVFIFLISLVPGSTTRAASIVVDTAADTVDANGGVCAGMVIADLPGADGVTSLREAICAANGTTGADTISFAGNYTLTLDGSQLPAVTSEITIIGNGQANTVIQASTCNPVTLPGGCTPATHRVIEVGGGDLKLLDLTIRHGNADTVGAMGISRGGGIFLANGTIKIDSCTISDNYGRNGGGITLWSGTITSITDSTITRNGTTNSGGGILNYNGTINTINNSNFSNNAADINGGGISNGNEITTITDSTFTSNTALFGAGIYNDSANIREISHSVFKGNAATYSGGGISTNNSTTISLITHTVFEGNTSHNEGGGGIYNLRSYIGRISHSTFSGNSGDYGGGIHTALDGISFVSNCTFKDNVAMEDGGGIYSYQPGIEHITNSTFVNNAAGKSGGGIANEDNSRIYSIANNTFSGNAAGASGGAINNENVIDQLLSCTIYDNSAAASTGGINNTGTIPIASNNIITDNFGGNCGGSAPGTSTNNLTDPGGCWSWPSTTFNPTLHLGPLKDNGGPTKTHALLPTTPTNPAIDAGDPTLCAQYPVNDKDQRGVVRSDCDIGAFENTGDDAALIVITSNPSDGSTTPDVSQITVHFSKDVVSDFGADAANNLNNYLLVERGANGVFDTLSCLGGHQADDTQITITSATYRSASYTATLTLNPSPLPDGIYRLFVCGTTSIYDLIGLELNGGLSDTLIDFSIVDALPETGFAPGQVTTLAAQPDEKSYTSYSGLWLEIPQLGLETEIVGVPVVDGEWDVSWLGNQAGYLAGTAFPTWTGNTVITAHVWDAWNQPGAFAKLKTLQHGDQFYIHAFGQTYTYQVRGNFRVRPDNLNVLAHSEYDLVTLLTCERWSLWTGEYGYRRAVQAVLVDVQ